MYLTSVMLIISTLSACTLIPSNPTASDAPVVINTTNVTVTPLTLRGTEPFWSFVQTATGYALYSFPGASDVEEYVYTTTEIVVGSDIIITATPVDPMGTPISAQVSPATCNDGMSDMIYPFTVSLSYGIDVYSGCGQ